MARTNKSKNSVEFNLKRRAKYQRQYKITEANLKRKNKTNKKLNKRDTK